MTIRTALQQLARRCLLAPLVLALACSMALPARADTITTPMILTKTIAAMPSCLSYQVKGICFFLFCTLKGCTIRTSIRISHYVPDAIVSSYHEPLTHPWLDIGKPLAATMSAVGAAMMGMPVDSSSSSAREHREMATFKSVDAIGNPAGMILATLASGTLPSLPGAFGVPGVSELMKFPYQELPNIQQQWLSVPGTLTNNVLAGAASLAKAPSDILGKIAAVPGYLGKLQSAIGNVGSLMNAGMKLGDLGITVSKLTGVDLGPLQTVMQIAQGASGGGYPLGSLFCPGSASAFTLHFQSDLDSLFWRELIPVEMLYPASWIPTMQEVSKSPALSTWGGRYPRTGKLVQSHPVKASAVYAERVASIITRSAQPHIYTPLSPGGGFKYFSQFSGRRWQMLSPSSTSCIEFGDNDSLSLASFGDFKTSSTDGYVWNLWHNYDCCQRRGIYLFTVP